MKQYPGIYDVRDVVTIARQTTREIYTVGGSGWVPARPLGLASVWHRIRATWMVWTGRADALTWPGQ